MDTCIITGNKIGFFGVFLESFKRGKEKLKMLMRCLTILPCDFHILGEIFYKKRMEADALAHIKKTLAQKLTIN